jgi:hypothetical protein
LNRILKRRKITKKVGEKIIIKTKGKKLRKHTRKQTKKWIESGEKGKAAAK